MKTITTDNFEQEVLKSEVPTMLKFTGSWCVPCSRIQPVLDQLAKDLEGKAKIVKVDVDDSPDLASKFKIKSIPAMLVFKNGEVVANQVGSAPKEKLLSLFGDLSETINKT